MSGTSTSAASSAECSVRTSKPASFPRTKPQLAAWFATSATATRNASSGCPWRRTEERRKRSSGTASVPIRRYCTSTEPKRLRYMHHVGHRLAPPPVRRVPAGQELRDLLSEYDENARRMVSGGGWAEVGGWVDQRAARRHRRAACRTVEHVG